MGRIFRNGIEIFAEKTLTEAAEFNITINDLMEGDLFDFAVDFGVDWGGDANNDNTAYSIIVDHTGDFVAVPGDFNGNGVLDAPDIDDLTGKVAGGTNPAAYDLNNDAKVNDADIKVWIKDLYNSWVGDANLDLEFSSSDLVSVLGAGTYETGKASVWSTGDFTGDALTTSSDLVAALSDGGYELGPRAAVSAVPEPASWLLVLLGCLPLFGARRTRKQVAVGQ